MEFNGLKKKIAWFPLHRQKKGVGRSENVFFFLLYFGAYGIMWHTRIDANISLVIFNVTKRETERVCLYSVSIYPIIFLDPKNNKFLV